MSEPDPDPEQVVITGQELNADGELHPRPDRPLRMDEVMVPD